MPACYKHSAPLEPGGDGCSGGYYSAPLEPGGDGCSGGYYSAPLEPGGDGCSGGYYSAPLEPGGDGNACVLQTFGSAGAGWRCDARGATNVRLRWSRVATEMPACYKHSAPLEPRAEDAGRATSLRLRCSRGERAAGA